MILKRPILLIVMLWLFAAVPAAAQVQPPLPGTNTITNVRLQPLPTGFWTLSFDYFYTGEPAPLMILMVQQVQVLSKSSVQPFELPYFLLQRGAHSVSLDIGRPALGPGPMVTKEVAVFFARMDAPARQPLGEAARVEQTIAWADEVTFVVDRELGSAPLDVVMKRMVGLIDGGVGYELGHAKRVLERIIEKDSRFDAAYVELARIAMRTNWNAEGLRQAESLIRSALQVRPDSANAKILLGYVLTHQKRFKDAEALFSDAAQQNPPNLWLWVNWGEALAMQGRQEAAMQKWRAAIAPPPTGDTYDRARQGAYRFLLSKLDDAKDDTASESLLKKRAEEYPVTECFQADYARFLVLRRGAAAQALEIARAVPPAQCAAAREVQGLAYYTLWAQGKDPERTEALHRARVVLPVSPNLFYLLATTDSTAAVAHALAQAGESVAVQDNEQMDALSYALRARNAQAAARLLKLGAKADAKVGVQQMPVALLPVLMRDFEGIRLMRRSGVDYTTLRYQNATALDHARRMGDKELLKVLGAKSVAL